MVYCKACGTTAVSKRVMRGQVALEVAMWTPALLFLLSRALRFFRELQLVANGDAPGVSGAAIGTIEALIVLAIPGIAYSIWRNATAYQGCAHCTSDDIIPAGSPLDPSHASD